MNDCTFTVRFIANGPTLESLSARVYEHIDDGSLMGPDRDGSYLIEFDRRAPGLAPAVSGALKQLSTVLPDAVILRVEGDELATISAIAERAGRSDESVRLLIDARRGPGGFPPAAGRLGSRTRVWRWADVSTWFQDTLGEPLGDADDSRFLQVLRLSGCDACDM